MSEGLTALTNQDEDTECGDLLHFAIALHCSPEQPQKALGEVGVRGRGGVGALGSFPPSLQHPEGYLWQVRIWAFFLLSPWVLRNHL